MSTGLLDILGILGITTSVASDGAETTLGQRGVPLSTLDCMYCLRPRAVPAMQ